MTTAIPPGASEQAIRHHYDVSNAFYQRWLDPEMVYSCASYSGHDQTGDLAIAQLRKLDMLGTWAQLGPGDRFLDIGCGWGAMLRRGLVRFGAKHATGLSLSQEQVAWIRQDTAWPMDVRLENWMAHCPSGRYDAIISIEAMEAFVRPGYTRHERIRIYREFFERCHAWLKPSKMLVLQTIAYGNAGPEDLDPFVKESIFPESDLPCLFELAEASDRRFEICRLVNDRHDYLLTVRAWLASFATRRQALVELVGERVVDRYEKYLNLCTYLFASGSCHLYRIAFRRIDFPREAGIQAPQPSIRENGT